MPRRGLLALVAVSAVAIASAACSVSQPKLRPAPPVTTAGPTTAPPVTAAPPASVSSAPPSTPASSGSATTASTTAPALRAATTIVATVKPGVGSVPVFDSPSAGRAARTLPNPGEYGQPQVLVVVERRPGWARVDLPVRPNGSTGWVREPDVDLAQHDYRIEVSLSGHRFQVFKGTDRLVDAPAGIGTSDTPTPGGTYYTWVLIDPTNSGYGAYAYGLSGFSEQLSSFGGGNGRLGIHGTTDVSSIGRDVSHGCIRIGNDVVTRLVTDIGLPLGVPVLVTA